MLIDHQEIFEEVFQAKSKIDKIALLSSNLLFETNDTLNEIIQSHEDDIKDFDENEYVNELIKIVNNLVNEIKVKIIRILINIK